MVRLGGEAGRRAVGHRRKEGDNRGSDAGRSEGDPARDLLEGGSGERRWHQLGKGKSGRRETGGWPGGVDQRELDEEAAAVAVVAEPLVAKFEDPARSPTLELGLLGGLGGRDGDEGVGRVLPQPVVGGLLELLRGRVRVRWVPGWGEHEPDGHRR